MGRRWTAAGGWDIELIRLDGRACYRVRQHRVLVGYAYSDTELAVLLAECGLDPGELVEAAHTGGGGESDLDSDSDSEGEGGDRDGTRDGDGRS